MQHSSGYHTGTRLMLMKLYSRNISSRSIIKDRNNSICHNCGNMERKHANVERLVYWGTGGLDYKGICELINTAIATLHIQ